MDLKLFFSPLEEGIINIDSSKSSFIKSIHASAEKMPDTKGMDIAIYGVEEERGGPHNPGTGRGPDEVRKKLYRLKKGTGSYRIVDLGNLRNGVSLDDTYIKIMEVNRFLLEKNIVPVIIGGSHDLDYAQYQAYEEMEKLVSVLNVDA